MKVIDTSEIIHAVENLCITANYYLNNDILDALQKKLNVEESDVGVHIINKIIENAHIARSEEVAICQDTGMAVVFVEIGQDVHISGGSILDAINEGVRRGYEKGFLRKSVVKDPIQRVNTGDNTPAVVHYDIVKGDKLKIVVAPKGFGSENMSALKMLKPADGLNFLDNPKEGEALQYLFEISKSIGADLSVLKSDNIIKCIADFAKEKEINCIVLGESPQDKVNNVFYKKLKSMLGDNIDIMVVP
jgi:tartrate dehydratase alpha subunit/fumarate hydratase class I-like protein